MSTQSAVSLNGCYALKLAADPSKRRTALEGRQLSFTGRGSKDCSGRRLVAGDRAAAVRPLLSVTGSFRSGSNLETS